ncbi:unnamed protein product [Rotaria socialis]|uniref:Uncharacterized protein n=1 Tax=Rotaria socialis TaxID=392032 RepID=A0A820QPS9_9BILA|nr:unnamed protein product [Rotaria socialis]
MSRLPLQAMNFANQQNMAVQNNNNIPPAPPFQGFVVFLQQQQQSWSKKTAPVSGLLRRPLRRPEWLSWELQQQSSVNRGRTRHLGLGGICRGCDRTRAGGVLRHNGLTRVGDRVRGGSGEIGGGKKISTRRATH